MKQNLAELKEERETSKILVNYIDIFLVVIVEYLNKNVRKDKDLKNTMNFN